MIPIEEAPFKISVIPTNSLFDPIHFSFRIKNEEGTFIYAPLGTKAKSLPKADVLITTTTTFELPFWLGGNTYLGYKKALTAKKTHESQGQKVRILKQGEALEYNA